MRKVATTPTVMFAVMGLTLLVPNRASRDVMSAQSPAATGFLVTNVRVFDGEEVRERAPSRWRVASFGGLATT
jgi:hypothetical protein